jgi:hypothetical protein
MFREDLAEIARQIPRPSAISSGVCVFELIIALPVVPSKPWPEPVLHPQNKIAIADNIKKTVFFIFIAFFFLPTVL